MILIIDYMERKQRNKTFVQILLPTSVKGLDSANSCREKRQAKQKQLGSFVNGSQTLNNRLRSTAWANIVTASLATGLELASIT